MRFRVLGPLEVNATAASGPGARELTPRAAKIRLVLATLLVHINDVVSVDTFIDELWGDAPPRTALTTLQVYISQVRKMLQDADPQAGPADAADPLAGLRTPAGSGGVGPDHLRGPAPARPGGDGAAGLPRGRRPPEQGAGAVAGAAAVRHPHGALLGSVQVRLTETRAAALEQRIRAELQLGHHRAADRRNLLADRGVPPARGVPRAPDGGAVPHRPAGRRAVRLRQAAPHSRRRAGHRAQQTAPAGAQPRADRRPDAAAARFGPRPLRPAVRSGRAGAPRAARRPSARAERTVHRPYRWRCRRSPRPCARLRSADAPP